MTDTPRIGIDAINLLGGGGRTHLIELLGASDPARHGFSTIIVWGCPDTLEKLPKRPWIEPRPIRSLSNATVFHRSFWQIASLSREARRAGCDVLLVPGGSFFGSFHPFVAMSQNMLPFELAERARYGWSLKRLRLALLHLTQRSTFRRADAVISLSGHARAMIEAVEGIASDRITVIPHGVSPRFHRAPDARSGSSDGPLTLLYVSPIEPYKHHDHVIAGVARARQDSGRDLRLRLVGPGSLARRQGLKRLMQRFDKAGRWISYAGPIPFDQIDREMKAADIALFASSCEACPNILLEYMAAGLPILSSDRGPMPEITGEAAVHFDPEDATSLASALVRLVKAPELRDRIAREAHGKAREMSWTRCADDSFSLLIGSARAR
ncbi:glycosyltransferase family 4 protein [Rhizorhabdus sp. FW153]|uniref:glycosyltransferase family 4 protein n=1 Tax=Rhizorhabdus sp. FW153 TaxID=3400216 RepID=UPI003CF0BE9F